MGLDKSIIIEIIQENQEVKDWIETAREMHAELKALFYGEEYKELILRIEHIESEKKAKARKNYSRPIVDTNEKILRPVDNIYSATGGSKHYDLSPKDTKTLLEHLSNVRGGYSLDRFLETFWSKDLYVVDPSGVMFLESDKEKIYPTYKSIDNIRDYKSGGLQLEWILFDPIDLEDGRKKWRFVDNEYDYIIIQDGDQFMFLDDESFKHEIGYCPGRVNSDIIQLGKQYRLSPLHSIIPTEREFIRDRSILSMFKFLNGFSTPYRPKIICPECKGLGKTGASDCDSCDGKGFILDKDVTDEIIIPIDLNRDEPIPLPSDFAGFITPDLEIWNQYNDESKRLFNEMFETVWGTRESDEVKDQTAMGVIMNTQPMVTRLDKWSKVDESHEKAFTEMIANYYLSKDKSKEIANINNGRNFIIQPPEFLLKEYQESKIKKDPITVLDSKLIEYLTSKYKNDLKKLDLELKKKKLEPYVHYDIMVINTIYGNVEAQKKGLFTDFWEKANKEKDILVLEKEMNEFFNQNIKQDENSSGEVSPTG